MSVRAAVGFLTRVPVGPTDGLARAAPWFPVVGGGIGLIVAGVSAAAALAVNPIVAATLAVAAGMALTGALHEDGLADLADAMGARTPEEARGILKDPAHGTYGVLALVMSVALRVGAIASLGTGAALLWLPAAHAVGRASAVALAGLGPAAPGPGSGSGFIDDLPRRSAARAVAIGGVIATGMLWWWAIPALALAAAGCAGVGRLARRKVGGLTGDALGAVEQVTEIAILLLGAAVASQGWPSPW